jgi:hypothetical protein
MLISSASSFSIQKECSGSQEPIETRLHLRRYSADGQKVKDLLTTFSNLYPPSRHHHHIPPWPPEPKMKRQKLKSQPRRGEILRTPDAFLRIFGGGWVGVRTRGLLGEKEGGREVCVTVIARFGFHPAREFDQNTTPRSHAFSRQVWGELECIWLYRAVLPRGNVKELCNLESCTHFVIRFHALFAGQIPKRVSG